MPFRLLTESQIAAVRQAKLLRSVAPPSPSPSSDAEEIGSVGASAPPGGALMRALVRALVRALGWSWGRAVWVGTGIRCAIAWLWKRAWSANGAIAPGAPPTALCDARYVAIATSNREYFGGGGGGARIPDASDEELSAVSRHVSTFQISRLNRC